VNLSLAKPTLVLTAVAACVGAGFFELFTTFLDYDDEGWLLLGNQLFIDGNRPYSDMPILNGPAWLAITALMHGLLGVPVDHEAVRYMTLVNWLLLSGAAALLTRLMGTARGFPLLAFLLSFLFLRSIANEPGHPQAIVALLMLASVVAVSAADERQSRGAWILAGVATGTTFLIKHNAGAFCAAASAVVLAGSFAYGRGQQRTLRAAFTAGSFLAPFALMYPLLSNRDCLAFAAVSGLATAAVSVIVTSPAVRPPVPRYAGSALLLGAALATTAVLVFAAMKGIDTQDFLPVALQYARDQVRFYHFFRHYTELQLALGAVSLALAITVSRASDTDMARRILPAGKAVFACAAVFALVIDGPANPQAMTGYAGPWCWVVASVRLNQPCPVGRSMLAALGVWSPLIAYPMPGSQLYFGSLPILIAAVVCASDISSQARHECGRMFSRWIPRLAVASALATVCWRLDAGWQRFERFAPLDLPGTGPLRLEPARSSALRELVETLRPADLVVTTFRFDSLRLWRREHRLSPADYSHWPLPYASPQLQERVRSRLLAASAPRVVTRRTGLPRSTTIDWIDANFETERTIGPYAVLRRRTAQPE
jgi:hypothetical protein